MLLSSGVITFCCDQNYYHKQFKARFYLGSWIQMVTWSFGPLHLSRTYGDGNMGQRRSVCLVASQEEGERQTRNSQE